MYATFDISTFTDADFSRELQVTADAVSPFESGSTLLMEVRKTAAAIETFISLASQDGVAVGSSGIDAGADLISDGKFSIIIDRSVMQKMPVGVYVYSVIHVTPAGIRDDILRGNFTVTAGPTR